MTGFVSCLLLEVQCLLHRRSSNDLLVPGMACWILFLPIESFIHGQPPHNAEPWDKHQVCVGDFLADEIFVSGLLEVRIDDSNYTLDLVAITVFGGLDLFVFVELWSICQVCAS